MLLRVQVEEWELQENGRTLNVGDQTRSWLTFREVERWAPPADRINVIHGVAVALPAWPGAELGRRPVQIDLDGGALYWDAPEPVSGPVDVAGTISTNDVDAPDGFPETSGVVRRLLMVWQDMVMGPVGSGISGTDGFRYEDVTTSYIPIDEQRPLEPEIEAELCRRARQAHVREIAAGRLHPGDSFEVALHGHRSAREVPVGATESRWTGVLMDLETADSAAR